MLNNKPYEPTVPTKKGKFTQPSYFMLHELRSWNRRTELYPHMYTRLRVYACALPGMEHRALCMSGKCSSTACSPGLAFPCFEEKQCRGFFFFFFNKSNSIPEAIIYSPFISISYFLYILTKTLNVTSSGGLLFTEFTISSLNYF